METINELPRAQSTHTCHWWQRHNPRWLTVLAAMSAASVLYAVAGPLLGIDLAVRAGAGVQRVEALAVPVASVLIGLAGWGLLTLLGKVTTKAATTWRVIAGVVLAVSLLGPLGATSPAAGVTLAAMHLVVGGLLLWGLPRQVRCSCAP